MKDGAEPCGLEVKKWGQLGKRNYAKCNLICCVLSGSLCFLKASANLKNEAGD